MKVTGWPEGIVPLIISPLIIFPESKVPLRIEFVWVGASATLNEDPLLKVPLIIEPFTIIPESRVPLNFIPEGVVPLIKLTEEPLAIVAFTIEPFIIDPSMIVPLNWEPVDVVPFKKEPWGIEPLTKCPAKPLLTVGLPELGSTYV